MALLDVRPDLAAGRDPFSRIMKAVDSLAPNEPLELVAPFEPQPLYRVMETKGFEHSTSRTSDGAWLVTFRRIVTEGLA